MFTAGSLSSPYPVRHELTPETQRKDHSLGYSAADRRRLQRLYARNYEKLKARESSPGLRDSGRVTGQRITRRDIDIERSRLPVGTRGSLLPALATGVAGRLLPIGARLPLLPALAGLSRFGLLAR